MENGENVDCNSTQFRTAKYLLSSYYAIALRRWLTYFHKDRILILNCHQLDSEANKFFASVFNFLELPDYSCSNLKYISAHKHSMPSQHVIDNLENFYRKNDQNSYVFFNSDSTNLNFEYQISELMMNLSVVTHTFKRDLFYGYDIELPKHGERISGRQLTIFGWVVGKMAVASKVEVVLRHEVIGEFPINLPRPELVEKFGVEGHSGRENFAFRGKVNLPSEDADYCKLDLYAVLSNSTRAIIGTIKVGQEPKSLSDKRYHIVICTCIKNEAPYLLEWIAYHRVMKVDHFLIYNNGSTDRSNEILKVLDDEDVVTCIDWPTKAGERPQITAFQDGIRRLKDHTEWIAFIDLDEFIFPKKHSDIKSFLKDYQHIDAIAVNWKLFGSSGHLEMLNELVIKRFTKCAEKNYSKHYIVKTIAKVDSAQSVNAHTCRLSPDRSTYIYPDGCEFETRDGIESHFDHDIVQINHYCTKSRAEWELKRNKGKGDAWDRAEKWPLRHFKRHDTNENIDVEILKYVDKTEKELEFLEGLGNLATICRAMQSEAEISNQLFSIGKDPFTKGSRIQILDILQHCMRESTKAKDELSCLVTSLEFETYYPADFLMVAGWISGNNLERYHVSIMCDGNLLALEDGEKYQSIIQEDSDGYSLESPKRFFVMSPSLVGLNYCSELEIWLVSKSIKSHILSIRFDPNPISDLVRPLLREGNNRQAIEACKDRLKVNPDYWQALKQMGLIYKSEFAWEQAADCFHEAAIIHPSDHWLKLQTLSCMLKGGDNEKIESYIDLVI